MHYSFYYRSHVFSLSTSWLSQLRDANPPNRFSSNRSCQSVFHHGSTWDEDVEQTIPPKPYLRRFPFDPCISFRASVNRAVLLILHHVVPLSPRSTTTDMSAESLRAILWRATEAYEGIPFDSAPFLVSLTSLAGGSPPLRQQNNVLHKSCRPGLFRSVKVVRRQLCEH